MRCDEGKTRYPTHHAAIKMIIWANFNNWKKGKDKVMPIRAYRCPFCGAWHVTSQPRRPRRRSVRTPETGE